ncbi:hypothetical protein [Hymenobacter sp. APR13]|uniref:hypothetical protein n=1 Tax=Hymenobacter sp. APR13 TaxID=1356852 RepID=UPI000ACBEE98|nr:hypothetical protein [Hymenobacter sp. APR13]
MAQPGAQELQKADSAFVAGAYTPAYQLYRQVLRQHKVASPQMLLRMAYVQDGLGHYPAALYYLSMAYKRQPSLATWRKMAALARDRRLTGYPDTWRQDLRLLVQRYYYPGLQVLLIGAVAGGMLLILRRRRLSRGWWVSYGTYLLLAGVYLLRLAPERAALVARPRAALMSGPSAGASWLTTAAAGDRLLVQGRQDTWYRVQWQGQDAYIRTQDLLLVQ